jgi:uncharacterized SAM-binding protein YcdF (DUF218 family)
VLRDLAKITLATLTGGLLVVGYMSWRIWDQGTRDEARRADAIVVLGAAQYNGTPSRILEARVAHAVELYHDGLAPILIVTGGKQPGDVTTEAAVARAYALAHDVPDSAILVEDRGRTTLESMRTVATILRDHDLRTAVFVSDRTHLLRVLKMAADVGVEGYGSPTTTSPNESTALDRFRATIREIGALGLYFVAGTGT